MVTQRLCDQCHQPLPALARTDARYCSTRCRVMAHRYQHAADDPLPVDLRSRDRWVRHISKRPVQVDGAQASTTNPATWSSYQAASSSRAGDGLGFVLNGDGIVCLDLDHCLHGNRLEPWAAEILSDLPRTYIERSPSGHGLHVWGTAQLQGGKVVTIEGGRVELYGNGRYLTMTGRPFRNAPSRLADLSEVVASLD